MKIALAAAQVLQGVIDQQRSLEQGIEKLADELEDISSAVKEIAYGSCRHYVYLNAILQRLVKKPLKKHDRIVHFLLVCSIYQIMYMQTPDHAVVNESVDAIGDTRQGWAKRLVNGVLRNFIRNKEKLHDSISDEHLIYAFPKHLFDSIRHDWPEEFREILNASNHRPPLTLRVSRRNTNRDEYAEELVDRQVKFVKTIDSNIGITLDTPVPVEAIPGFKQGRVSVQDESAQLVVDAMELAPGLLVLDSCAAPGGKTGSMLEAEPSLSSLTALDFAHRTLKIKQNLERLKLKATVISADILDPTSWWDGKKFDRILLDAPCSGTGVIRRHPDIRHRRQPTDIEKFAQQQQDMLEIMWPMLNPGGKLIYVTCSVLRAENDDVIEKFLNNIKGFELQLLDPVFGFKTRFGRQRLPGVHSGDGFYYCKLNHSRGSDPIVK